MELRDPITANKFCGYCGAKMKEVLHPQPGFDRTTGERLRTGALYWQCPKRGVGSDVYRGTDWDIVTYEANPHDHGFLRNV